MKKKQTNKQMIESIRDDEHTSVIRVIVFFLVLTILTAVALAIWNSYASNSYDNKQDTKINTLMMQEQNNYNSINAQLVILNTTLYAQYGELNLRITVVNSTIYTQLDYIYDILNISGGNASSFAQYVNNSLIAITGDINNIQMNITTIFGQLILLQGNITEIYNNLTQVWSQLDNLEATKLETINGVPGDTINKNVNLVSVNDNLIITNNITNNTIYFNVLESVMMFVTENGTVVPNTTGQVTITGGPNGLIDVQTSDANSVYVNADGINTVLTTQNNSISNLDSRVAALENSTTNSTTSLQIATAYNAIEMNLTSSMLIAFTEFVNSDSWNYSVADKRFQCLKSGLYQCFITIQCKNNDAMSLQFQVGIYRTIPRATWYLNLGANETGTITATVPVFATIGDQLYFPMAINVSPPLGTPTGQLFQIFPLDNSVSII